MKLALPEDQRIFHRLHLYLSRLPAQASHHLPSFILVSYSDDGAGKGRVHEFPGNYKVNQFLPMLLSNRLEHFLDRYYLLIVIRLAVPVSSPKILRLQ